MLTCLLNYFVSVLQANTAWNDGKWKSCCWVSVGERDQASSGSTGIVSRFCLFSTALLEFLFFYLKVVFAYDYGLFGRLKQNETRFLAGHRRLGRKKQTWENLSMSSLVLLVSTSFSHIQQVITSFYPITHPLFSVDFCSGHESCVMCMHACTHLLCSLDLQFLMARFLNATMLLQTYFYERQWQISNINSIWYSKMKIYTMFLLLCFFLHLSVCSKLNAYILLHWFLPWLCYLQRSMQLTMLWWLMNETKHCKIGFGALLKKFGVLIVDMDQKYVNFWWWGGVESLDLFPLHWGLPGVYMSVW